MRGLASALVLGCLLISTASALAETASQGTTATEGETPADDRAAQFVGVTGPEAESVPGGALLLAAYAVAWVLLFLFLMRMRGLQRQTARDLERLSADVRGSGGS